MNIGLEDYTILKGMKRDEKARRDCISDHFSRVR